MRCRGYGRPGATTSNVTPTSPAPNCSTTSSRSARAEGFEWGSHIAGHLVGEFPHKKIAGTATEWYIMPGSTKPMRRNDPSGRRCHWILEIHLIDPRAAFGGFYEQLLDLP